MTLGNVAGLPDHWGMATTYFYASYQLKPVKSLLAAVFFGAETMALSVWGAWMFITALIARRIKEY